MLAILEDKREAVAALCRKHGVARLYVFGSMDGHSKAHAYFEMLDELRELLSADVDLVMTGAVKNRYIASDIESSKQMVYAA